jgi:hypothetical protein
MFFDVERSALPNAEQTALLIRAPMPQPAATSLGRAACSRALLGSLGETVITIGNSDEPRCDEYR